MQSLVALQSWMQNAIASQSRSSDEAASVLVSTPSLSAVERLGIYQRAYVGRLLECMRELFPVLRLSWGDETFDEFAIGYLNQYPSRSYTLQKLGDRFATFLAETRPPSDDGTLDWLDIFIDLAKFENLVDEIFVGPGTESEPPFSIPPDISPETFLSGRLVCNPSLKIVTLRFPVHEYWSERRRGGECDLPTAGPTTLALYRREYIVRYLNLSPAAAVLFTSLMSNSSIADAMSEALDHGATETEARTWFELWTREGLFVRMEW